MPTMLTGIWIPTVLYRPLNDVWGLREVIVPSPPLSTPGGQRGDTLGYLSCVKYRENHSLNSLTGHELGQVSRSHS